MASPPDIELGHHAFEPEAEAAEAAEDWSEWAAEPIRHRGPRARPYVLTRGRTQARRHLAIEALVSTRPEGRWSSARLSGEFRSVRTLCGRPRSVAEVAATLSVPLGVVRVLLDDMADQGLVTIHDTRTASDGRPAMALMEQVLAGLRRL